jgi:hypothetical protein
MLKSFEREGRGAGAGASNQEISAHQFSDSELVRFFASIVVGFRLGGRPLLGAAVIIKGLDGTPGQHAREFRVLSCPLTKLESIN